MRECLNFCGSGQDIRASLNYEPSGIPLVSSPVMHCLLEAHGPLCLIADLAAFEKNYPLPFLLAVPVLHQYDALISSS